MVSAILERLNHNAIDNVDVEVHPSEFSVKYNCGYVTDIDTTSIKSIVDDEMDHLLGLLHSEGDDDILEVDLQIIQA